MECPGCGKKINDNSKFCRFCGAEQEMGFCTSCGNAVAGKSSKQGGVFLLVILISVVSLVIWNGAGTDPAPQTDPNNIKTINPTVIKISAKEDKPSLIERAQKLILKSDQEKEYDVISSTSMSFDDIRTYEIYLLVKEGESKRKQVEFAKEEINSLSERDENDIVLLYTCENPKCQEVGEFLGEFVSVNLKVNPNYTLEDDFEFLTESLALRWN